MEQEVIDMTNEIAKNGLIFFPEFCKVVLRKFREDDEEQFAQVMFKMLCGTDPLPELFRAKKYKIHDRYLNKTDFKFIMNNLPIPVSETDVEEMFTFADKDNDGRISYKEFRIMINPPKPIEGPKPTRKDLQLKYQDPVLEIEQEESEYMNGSVDVTLGRTESELVYSTGDDRKRSVERAPPVSVTVSLPAADISGPKVAHL
ncbi:calmodulin-like protein 4 [Eurytemora carolleeae]|uniref:calmodulin-like protein 4 n=1 Tax=Eurytemora carolleeae TaxID=1294199 RepID=UPI000C7739C6|nr:calmodulin-like protein 4 [Eurytemora carolleeae]|eukprot:XP_023324888.1 calmodulin-like protein 4 [Eurytemora affinis]